MDFIKRNAKRIATDSAGYLLLVAALLTGWLPGPGGIPLALAGLGLLSINNEWAKRLREWLIQRGGRVVKVLFPNNPYVQWFYDVLVVLLLVLVGIMAEQHNAIWQISLAIFAFCIALLIALMNRDRLERLKPRSKL